MNIYMCSNNSTSKRRHLMKWISCGDFLSGNLSVCCMSCETKCLTVFYLSFSRLHRFAIEVMNRHPSSVDYFVLIYLMVKSFGFLTFDIQAQHFLFLTGFSLCHQAEKPETPSKTNFFFFSFSMLRCQMFCF